MERDTQLHQKTATKKYIHPALRKAENPLGKRGAPGEDFGRGKSEPDAEKKIKQWSSVLSNNSNS